MSNPSIHRRWGDLIKSSQLTMEVDPLLHKSQVLRPGHQERIYERFGDCVLQTGTYGFGGRKYNQYHHILDCIPDLITLINSSAFHTGASNLTGSMSNLHNLHQTSASIPILKSKSRTSKRKNKLEKNSVRTSNPAPPNQSWSPPPAPVLPVVPLRATMPRIAALPQRHRRRWQRLPKVLDLRACRQRVKVSASMLRFVSG